MKNVKEVMIKYPYYIKIFDKELVKEKYDSFFLKEENVFFYPEHIKEELQYGDVELDPQDDETAILHMQKSTAQIICKVLNGLNILFELKNIRQDVIFGKYPFEISKEFEDIIKTEIFRTLTLDEILDKINVVGIKSLSKEENDFLLSQTLDIS